MIRHMVWSGTSAAADLAADHADSAADLADSAADHAADSSHSPVVIALS